MTDLVPELAGIPCSATLDGDGELHHRTPFK